MTLAAAVPARYRGVWKRTLLSTPDGIDDTSTVLWLQASRWHADIRIPAGRPSFAGVHALADCSDAQLRFLARRAGFAGVTEIDLAAKPEICRWRRRWDAQPPAATEDAGRMVFQHERILETGVHADYLEHWQRLPDSVGESVECVDDSGCVLAVGGYVMRMLPRRAAWPPDLAPGTSLAQLVDALLPTQRDRVLGWLDVEISFGRRDGDGWIVLHSTLPWMEGKTLPLPAGMGAPV